MTTPQPGYQWGYLQEALEVDGANACELLLTSSRDRDIHVAFLRQISESDPGALHVVISDQVIYHQPVADPRLLPTSARYLGRPLVPNSIGSSASPV